MFKYYILVAYEEQDIQGTLQVVHKRGNIDIKKERYNYQKKEVQLSKKGYAQQFFIFIVS